MGLGRRPPRRPFIETDAAGACRVRLARCSIADGLRVRKTRWSLPAACDFRSGRRDLSGRPSQAEQIANCFPRGRPTCWRDLVSNRKPGRKCWRRAWFRKRTARSIEFENRGPHVGQAVAPCAEPLKLSTPAVSAHTRNVPSHPRPQPGEGRRAQTRRQTAFIRKPRETRHKSLLAACLPRKNGVQSPFRLHAEGVSRDAPILYVSRYLRRQPNHVAASLKEGSIGHGGSTSARPTRSKSRSKGDSTIGRPYDGAPHWTATGGARPSPSRLHVITLENLCHRCRSFSRRARTA